MSGKYVGLSQYGLLGPQNDVVLAPEKLGTFLGSAQRVEHIGAVPLHVAE